MNMRNQKMAAALRLLAFVLLAALLAAPAAQAQAPVDEPGKSAARGDAVSAVAEPLTRAPGAASMTALGAAFAPDAPDTINLSTNFETATWPGEGWTVVNGSQADQWYIGTPAGNGASEAGSNAAYVSNDSGANFQYGSSPSVVHFYRDVTFPANEPSLQLTFDWRGVGEMQGSTHEDFLQVSFVETTVTPLAGTRLDVNNLLYHSSADWTRATVTIDPSWAGATARVVFSWINDGDTNIGATPAAVDNILIYAYPAEYGYGNCITQASGMDNCTANDLSYGAFQVLNVSGQCTTPSSTVQVTLKGGVATNSNMRYDMAFWINVAGGSALSDPTRLACYRHVLTPLVSDPWTGLDLKGGEGPYRNLDGDYCGDAYSSASDGWNIVNFQTLTLPCADNDGDGALDFSICLGYDNQAVNSCRGYLEAWPSEKPKCLCGHVDVDVSTLKMSITKSCTPDAIAYDSTNRTIACTITYKNESNSATTAGTFQIVDDYDETMGSVSDVSEPGPGTNDGGAITWTLPAVAAGASGAVTYNYTINAGLAEGTVIRNTALLQYRAGTTGPYAQQDIASEDSTVIAAPTAVTLINLAATVQGDAIEIGWDTVNEMDHLGFNLYRAADAAGPGVKLNAGLIPAQGVGSPLGFHYSYLDAASLVPGTTYTYWLENVSTTGVATRHAPVSVLFGSGPNAVGLASFGVTPATAWPAAGLLLAALGALAAARRRKK